MTQFLAKAASSKKATMSGASDCVAEASSSFSDDRNTSISFPNAIIDKEAKHPSSASALSPSPTNIQTSPLSSFKIDLLTKSTIYRRHEARLARSYALRHDPRPFLIRIMSGLPGFRLIFSSYRGERMEYFDRQGEQNQRGKISITANVPGAYSEKNLFARYSDAAADNTVGQKITGRNDAMHAFAPQHMMQAILITGFCSGTTESIYTYCINSRTKHQKYTTISSASPFHNFKTATQHSSLCFHITSSAVSNITGPEVYNEIPNTANNSTLLKTTKSSIRPSTGVFSKALSVALPTSLLFGSKVFLDSVLTNQENDDNALEIANNILSSAFAGAVVGSSRLALLQVKRRQQLPPSSLSLFHQQHLISGYSFDLMRRNVMGAILYFSIYDGVSSISSTFSPTNVDTTSLFSGSSPTRSDCSGKKRGTLDTVVGGALAGVAHAATILSHRYGQYGSVIWWSRVMLPAISRAAPIHASVFYGYEKMKHGVQR